jgi:hypothetical protein
MALTWGTSPAPLLKTPGKRKQRGLGPTRKVRLESGTSEKRQRDTNSNPLSSGVLTPRKAATDNPAENSGCQAPTSPFEPYNIPTQFLSSAHTFHSGVY